jgi:uncharacterized protein
MLLRQQLAEIIDSQRINFLQKDTGIPRDILPFLKVRSNFALIITGIRRCGKSTLLLQLSKTGFSNVFYLHFEDTRLAGFENQDFARLAAEIAHRKPEVILLDEIQIIDNWELFVRQLLDEGHKMVITGSNASLLSKELGTRLTGRHLPAELYPFSYKEFLAFNALDSTQEAAETYHKKGGFPEYLKTNDGFVLNQLLEDILYRDIAVRYGIRNIKALKQLAVYLISNIGKPISANKLTQLFDIGAASTILEYFSYLENAYLVQFVPQFSYSLKKQIRNMKKVYTLDLGLFTENSIVFSDESGRRLENTVFLHLRRRFKELYYFSEKGECDFITMEKGKAAAIIQVCYTLNPDNLARELSGLTEAMDFFELKKGIVVTLNQTDHIQSGERAIEVVPLKEFLEG